MLDYLELRVDGSGQISGTYRLPRRCTDRWGYERTAPATSVVVWIVMDISVRLDEGWLRSQGVVDRYDEAAGRYGRPGFWAEGRPAPSR